MERENFGKEKRTETARKEEGDWLKRERRGKKKTSTDWEKLQIITEKSQ